MSADQDLSSEGLLVLAQASGGLFIPKNVGGLQQARDNAQVLASRGLLGSPRVGPLGRCYWITDAGRQGFLKQT